MFKTLMPWLALVLLAPAGCGVTPAENDNIVAPDGKDDNFFSNTAQEYLASATVPIVLEPDYASKTEAVRLARANKIMDGKLRQISWFLHIYLIDKSSEDKAGNYGGVRAMVNAGSEEGDALKPDATDPTKYTFGFTMQIGGTKELLAKIRADKKLPASENSFPLDMAQLDNDQVISFSSSGYGAGDWSPDTCGCTTEKLSVKLVPLPASSDGYFDYAKMLADDVMDVSVHFGWDYHARYDITHSRTLYKWMVGEMGFTSPVKSYEEYNRLSGPLTRKVTVGAREILMKVTIFHPDPCESWSEDGSGGTWAAAVSADKKNEERTCPDWKWSDPQANGNPTTDEGAGNLMTSLKDSLRTRDAVIFSGHSGFTYGYALASWFRTSRGDLDPPEIKTLDLPKDRSQLFVMSGCDTYHVAWAFRENPNKEGMVNADVITTTSFSDASDVGDTQDLIRALVGNAGKFSAVSFGKLMTNLNPSTEDYGWGNFTMYGIHGLDDNPHANPLADPAVSCKACTADADCGFGATCVRLGTSEKVCAVQCLADDGCPTGQTCRDFGSATTGVLKGLACVPRSLSCKKDPGTQPTDKTAAFTGDLARGASKSHTVSVGTSARSIKVAMTGTGDADLYTRFGVAPTTSTYDCRPYNGSSKETCTHKTSKAGTLEIMVNGYAAQSHYDIKVSWQ